ncbi:MAG: hypothetical protein H6Q89_641 [Myxococcaceae bacterium]|nr:hypothetical protein [Myxococcaceae bacterium]
MLAILLGLTLATPPFMMRPDGTMRPGVGGPEPRPARDVTPDVVPFSGKSAKVTLRASKHAVQLRDILLDVVVPRGSHLLTEADPLQLPGPMLMIECSEHNELDGDVVVLGAAGLKVKGPKLYSVFAIEPFVTRFPGARLRMLKDNGAAILNANTLDVVQVPEDYRYALIVGLDPTAKYRVKVSGKPGLEQVLIVSDREFPPSEDLKPADAAWTASRLVLKGGGKADLPPTRQVALILAGVRGLVTEPNLSWERTIDVTIELAKAGTGEMGPERTMQVGSRSAQFFITVSRQLLQKKQAMAARPLLEQCVNQDPKNAECHLLYAQVWELFGDKATMQKHACLAVTYGEGDYVGDKARELLGGSLAACH